MGHMFLYTPGIVQYIQFICLSFPKIILLYLLNWVIEILENQKYIRTYFFLCEKLGCYQSDK